MSSVAYRTDTRKTMWIVSSLVILPRLAYEWLRGEWKKENEEAVNRASSSLAVLWMLIVLEFHGTTHAIETFLAFLFWDTLVRTHPPSLETIIHHAVTFTMSASGLLYEDQTDEFKNTVSLLLWMEITTPFLHLFWILLKCPYIHDYRVDPKPFFPAFLLLWIPFRIINPIRAILYTHYLPSSISSITFNCTLWCLLALQMYWFILLLQKAFFSSSQSKKKKEE